MQKCSLKIKKKKNINLCKRFIDVNIELLASPISQSYVFVFNVALRKFDILNATALMHIMLVVALKTALRYVIS